MDTTHILIVVLLSLLVAGVAYMIWKKRKSEGFVRGDDIVNKGWYVHTGPSTPVEEDYHTCVSNNCGAEDLWCQQKCYYKSMKRGGPTDRCDLLCQFKEGEEKWKCYDHCYGNAHGVIVMFE